MGNIDKYRGCLLGGAAGDALGYAIEFDREEAIAARYGSRGIRDYQLDERGLAPFSDDTQMTLYTANSLLCSLAALSAQASCGAQASGGTQASGDGPTLVSPTLAPPTALSACAPAPLPCHPPLRLPLTPQPKWPSSMWSGCIRRSAPTR